MRFLKKNINFIIVAIVILYIVKPDFLGLGDLFSSKKTVQHVGK